MKAGFVALVGRPNVGKSMLVNRLLGEKVSIVSPKPQTTRNRIHGILNRQDAQLVFVDTPGLTPARDALRQVLRGIAGSAASDSDLTVVVVEAQPSRGSAVTLSSEDHQVLRIATVKSKPALVVLNKIDRLPNKKLLLPWIARYGEEVDAPVVPVSALHSDGLEILKTMLLVRLPEGPPIFPTDLHTDQAERFLVAELVRERLLYRLRHEVPHSCHVVIEEFEDKREGERAFVRIMGAIVVERESQKGIVVGRQGTTIKAISTEARAEIEEVLQARIYLRLRVKVEKNWTQDPRWVRSYGFELPTSARL